MRFVQIAMSGVEIADGNGANGFAINVVGS